MTTPITNATPVKANAYVQVEGGVNNYTNAKEANLGATLGGQVSKGGTYAKANVGYGTAFKANAEIGHEFNIGKNMGLEISGNAEYVKSNSGSEYSSKFDLNANGSHVTNSFTKTWHDGFKKAGGAMMMAFHGKNGNVKVGLEAGGYSNSAPDISTKYNAQVENEEGNSTNLQYKNDLKAHHSGIYAIPKVSAELNLGKKGNWSLVADADKFGGNAGVRFTF